MELPKILIIDDEPDIRDLYKSFLEGEDYEIYEAEDGQEAFKLAEQQKFDLYVTDILMPEMNGVEFMKVLKMIDPDAIVIIITGYDDMQYTRQALEYGAFRFLTKPINMREFRSVIELGLLERKKLFKSTTQDKLQRLKEKLNSNPELHERVFNKLENFLMQMEELGTSYIEIGGPGAQGKVWAKVRGKFQPIKSERIFNQDEINIMLLTTLTNPELTNLLESKNLNFNFEFYNEGVKHRYRVFAYFDSSELVVGFKPTRRKIFDIQKSRIPKTSLASMTIKNENSGLVIFTGPAGSGKSSLIDTLIQVNNTIGGGNIFVFADSIEYYHESDNCVIRQQEIYSDINSLLEGLKSVISYDPSLVVIDEIKSKEILNIIWHLIDSGSLVYATFKNKSAIEALFSLINMYPALNQEQARQHLAKALKALVVNHLVPSGDKGVIPAHEILINNNQISHTIQNNNLDDIYQLMTQGKKAGMYTLEQDLFNLLRKKVIKPEDALEVCNNTGQLKDMVKYR